MLLVKANFNKTNVLSVLLRSVDLFNLSDDKKQTFGSGHFSLYHSILLYFIVSIAIVAN